LGAARALVQARLRFGPAARLRHVLGRKSLEEKPFKIRGVTAAICPWCQAPRAEGPSCPKCGANYAKAESIKKQGKAAAAPAPVPAEPAIEEKTEEFVSKTRDLKPLSEYVDLESRVDSEAEWKLCLVGIPAAFLVALLMHLVMPGMQ